jgi:hypothetical protein
MLLYVNGDSHSAAAEAVNSYCFAEDDPLYYALGRKPHPDNERVSYGCMLANQYNGILHCDAESASSNDRIMRVTQEYLNSGFKPDLIVIGWATWEREEWLHEGTYYQVTASGTDSVPVELQERYKHWVIEQSDPEVVNRVTMQAHDRIYWFHQQLILQNIPHLFFSTYHSFANIPNLVHLGACEYDWGRSYIEPYNDNMTYYNFLQSRGYKTVNPNSYHFGASAHSAWAGYLFTRLQLT